MASAAIDPREADRDPLTGLLSAAGGRALLARWASDGRCWQAMLVGLQRLQTVNRAFGQPAGDAALIEVAHRLRAFAGTEIGGDTFLARLDGSSILLVADCDCSRERWMLLADSLADALAAPIPLAGETIRLTARVALFRARASEAEPHAIEDLSHALAEVQLQPGRRTVWADGTLLPAGGSIAGLEEDLLRAIDRDEIAILFQPQFRFTDDALTGAEALARWEHPRIGRIGAATLFAVAERAQQSAQLGAHIAAKALGIAASWPAQRALRLSLNLTTAKLAAPTAAATLRRAFAASGFAPARLTLEVTEQALLGDLQQAAGVLRGLADDGVKIALDDFGSGFANFRYLKVLPLDYLKLHHTLTDEVVEMPRDRAILRAIVAMARALELEVIAEGVESEAQRLFLAAEGCDLFQGFVRSGPLDAAAFAAFLAR